MKKIILLATVAAVVFASRADTTENEKATAMKKLDFNVLFVGFKPTDFINCFAAVHTCLGGAQEKNDDLFFLFDTLSGRNSIRYRFDGKPTEMETLIGDLVSDEANDGTDYTVDFLFGFAGYEHRKITEPDAFKAAIVASIDAGRPIIAKVKTGKGRFRVIIGYDGDNLLEPSYENSLRWHPRSTEAITYGAMEALHIVGDKIKPRYTLVDGLERIRRVMEYNADEKIWGSFLEKLTFPHAAQKGDGWDDADTEERKTRMKRLASNGWTMNAYSFASGFRNPVFKELQNPELDELLGRITFIYGETFDLDYSLIAIAECANWGHRAYEGGFVGTIVQLAIEKIQKNEEEVLEIVKRAIEICEQQ